MPTRNGRDYWFMSTEVDQDVSARSGAPEGWILYFAYDEDMEPQRLRRRCPSAVLVAEACMSGLELCADSAGSPTLRKRGGTSPVGILWAVCPDEMEKLEHYQAARSFARKEKRVSFNLIPTNKRRRRPDSFCGPAVYFASRRTPFSLDKGNPEAFELIARKCETMSMGYRYLDKVNRIIQLSGGAVDTPGLPEEYLKYVCLRCFHQVHECTCAHGPNGCLIDIDLGVQRTVQVLNLKGYTTRYSCEGHPTGTYLMFAGSSYLPDAEPPEGFEWDGLCLRSLHDKGAALDELHAVKQQRLLSLEAWCDALPVNEKKPSAPVPAWMV